MKKFDIITIFPNIFDSYFGESIVKRAREKDIIKIKTYNLRDYTQDKHHNIDDTPYGGGAGMVMRVEPIYNCLKAIMTSDVKRQTSKVRTILFSAKGKRFTQADAKRLAEYDQIIMICGRYEGVDERVAENLIDEEISIGDFVLTGGEIPAMLLVDSVTRLLPGVLGNPDSLKEESFSDIENCKPARPAGGLEIENLNLEYPQYSKPEEFEGWKVPEVLLSGNHAEIEKWRKSKSKKTK